MKPKYYIWVFVPVHFLCSSPGFSEERSKSDKAGQNSPLEWFTEEQREKLGKGEVVFEYVIEDTDGVTEVAQVSKIYNNYYKWIFPFSPALRCRADHPAGQSPRRSSALSCAILSLSAGLTGS